jgi:Protein of unknown function (DUF2950)
MTISTRTFDGSRLRRREAPPLVASIAVLIAGFAPLSRASPPSAHSEQPTYLSAEDAANALFQALQSGSAQAVQKVLGADDQLISSADTAADERDRERFVQKYEQMHRLARQSDGTKILYIGAENWPFPVPLVATNGVWRFDTDAGAAEVLFRRIGENEITVMQALLTGEVSENKAVPYHGYYFRIVSRSPEGFAAVAYPAAYRSSGVMTFVITPSKVVYEKDLGPRGARTAQTMREIRADSTWVPAESVAEPR